MVSVSEIDIHPSGVSALSPVFLKQKKKIQLKFKDSTFVEIFFLFSKNIFLYTFFLQNIECMNSRYMFRNTLLNAISHCFMKFLMQLFMLLFVQLFMQLSCCFMHLLIASCNFISLHAYKLYKNNNQTFKNDYSMSKNF